MKTCPYCAESIQDAAIVCRYCGRDLPTKSDTSKPDSVGEKYRRLLEAIAQSDLKALADYPLDMKRRPDVIASLVAAIEPDFLWHTGGKALVNIDVEMWWKSSLDPKQAKKEEWRELVQKLTNSRLGDPDFPIFDEFLSAISYPLVAAIREGVLPMTGGTFDCMWAWQEMQKGHWMDTLFRVARGLTLGGAIANIADRVRGEKPPKRGTNIWNIRQRAYAQAEARLLGEMEP